MELIEYLANFNGEFNASLGESGGYITFSNSGRRGNIKYFQISLDSLKKTIEDILDNISIFENIQDYVEKNWRDNGSSYFSDEVANAMITVQTKPLFSTLSKLIKWGNEPTLDSVDDTSKMIITQVALENTLQKLKNTIQQYTPKTVKLQYGSFGSNGLPLQTIFYGAPGTGKSNTIKRDVEDQDRIHFRTTFHPDSDYSTFVGCYKPTMTSRKRIYSQGELISKLTEIKKSGITYPVQNFSAIYWESLNKLSNDEIKAILAACGFTDSMNVEVGKGMAVGQRFANHSSQQTIIYEFVPQAFTKAYCEAWNRYSENKESEPVFLIIEEINRGNCAQIFGDIFQLLDRKDGFSEYPIDADEDLKKFLLNGTKEDGTPWLVNKDGIKDGKLCLPANLHIWATMNTSDQSLFPIDSAFKRRWDWKYVPINTRKESWSIKANGTEYSWSDFLEKINAEIDVVTHSEDKKLGFYFCKAENGVISAERFVSKVLFYIYNDVFKDYGFDKDIFNDTDGKLSFGKFYQENGDIQEDKVALFLKNLGVGELTSISEKPVDVKVENAENN